MRTSFGPFWASFFGSSGCTNWGILIMLVIQNCDHALGSKSGPQTGAFGARFQQPLFQKSDPKIGNKNNHKINPKHLGSVCFSLVCTALLWLALARLA